MTYPVIILMAFSIAGLFISYHYLVVRHVDQEQKPTNQYEQDFNYLSDCIRDIKNEFGLRTAEKMITEFKKKYVGNAYLEYDLKRLQAHLDNRRIILNEPVKENGKKLINT